MSLLQTVSQVALGLMAVVEVAGGLTALLLGQRAPWLWFTLALYGFAGDVAGIALYREIDAVRWAGVLLAAAVAALVAFILQRRHRPWC